jgi:hypothetical protein
LPGMKRGYHGPRMAENSEGQDAAFAPTKSDASEPKLSLAEHAALSAHLAEGTRSQAELLQERGLSEEEWNDATQFWMMRLARDTELHGANATLAITYSDVFAKTQDQLKAIAELAPEEWATLTVEIQQQGLARPLAQRNLSNADYIRLARHFARLLSGNPSAHDRYWKTYQSLVVPSET